MSDVGSPENPLRVAIIGSGPAGFYTVSNLLKQKSLTVEMDMYDRLPTPFGLVRGGVAPDHQKYKTVTRAYDKSAAVPNFRFFGNVEYGRDILLDDLKCHYHQIVFTTGAQTDRNLGISGEDLSGSHSATEFVAWYNGHPDFVDYHFDLSQESVAIVGIGNVAVDVARILSKTPEELATTDMADYALEALRHSKVKNVYMLGRRGPAQAAFTPPEIKEMGELSDAYVEVLDTEASLDEASQAALDASGDKTIKKNVEAIQAFVPHTPSGKNKRLAIRFLVSPVEILGDDQGGIRAIKIVKNEPYLAEDGSIRPRATEQYEEIPVGLVFRSVGYRGVPLAEIPFNEGWGVIENTEGRIEDNGATLEGLYTAGWIKRGPSGVIGTNKTDAQETVARMVEDLTEGRHFKPESPAVASAESLVAERQPDFISYADWKQIDAIEVAKGEADNRPRVKFTNVADILAALNR